jgi:hypothetical protein
MRWLALTLLLCSCTDMRGTVGNYCNYDGSCDSPLLECTASELFCGIPVDEPSCQPKKKR